MTYWALAGVMVVGSVVLHVSVEHGHRVFWIEAWMIGWLAVFWSVQTWDRWGEGAPPRTNADSLRSLDGSGSRFAVRGAGYARPMSQTDAAAPPSAKQPPKNRTHWLYMAVIAAVALGIVVGLVFPDFAVKLEAAR